MKAIARVRTVIGNVLRRPVAPILATAGFFEILSGDPLVHATVLLAASAALVVDGRRHRAGSDPVPPSESLAGLRLTPAVIAGSLAYIVVAGGFARYSWPATAAVAPPAAGGVILAWRGPIRARLGSRLDRRGVLAWLAVLVGLALWELFTFLQQPTLTKTSWAHPTISALMDPILASHARRSAFLGLWLASGWYAVTR